VDILICFALFSAVSIFLRGLPFYKTLIHYFWLGTFCFDSVRSIFFSSSLQLAVSCPGIQPLVSSPLRLLSGLAVDATPFMSPHPDLLVFSAVGVKRFIRHFSRSEFIEIYPGTRGRWDSWSRSFCIGLPFLLFHCSRCGWGSIPTFTIGCRDFQRPL